MTNKACPFFHQGEGHHCGLSSALDQESIQADAGRRNRFGSQRATTWSAEENIAL
jgi:hypothetical protein